MRTLENIISESAETLRPFLREAFEAGRSVGRDEAAADLKAKIDGLLSPGQIMPAVAAVIAAAEPGKRALAGSVRPTIERLIIENAKSGLTMDDILKQTGFKSNSIRGTLWALGRDGIAFKQNKRWFPKTQNTNAVSAAS